jgi:hypothetical protein
MRGRGIAAGAVIAGLLTVATGCGLAGSPVTVGMRPAAAHEAIPVAAEGSLGSLVPASKAHRPRRPGMIGSGGNSGIGFGGAMFGGNDRLIKDQHALGRTLAIVRVYYHIGDTFPVVSDQEHMAAGSTLLISLDSRGTSYASIAAGSKDGAILSFLRAVNRAAYQYHLGAIYIDFEHEPDSPQHGALGSAAEFVRAWDHVHQLAASARLDWNNGGRLHWVLILIHGIYARSGPVPFWPGNATVDIIAADGYNSFRCKASSQNQMETPARLFNPVMSFAATHGGLPVFIAEWGSESALASAQVQFIQQMQSYVASNSRIAAALYWDDAGPNCNYAVDGHPAAIAALATMGHSAAMQGNV